MNDKNEGSVRFGRIDATLPVKDMNRAVTLYGGDRGFRKVFEKGDPVGFVILKRDEAELHLMLQKHHKAADFNVAHMMVENIDHLHDLVQARGFLGDQAPSGQGLRPSGLRLRGSRRQPH